MLTRNNTVKNIHTVPFGLGLQKLRGSRTSPCLVLVCYPVWCWCVGVLSCVILFGVLSCELLWQLCRSNQQSVVNEYPLFVQIRFYFSFDNWVNSTSRSTGVIMARESIWLENYTENGSGNQALW